MKPKIILFLVVFLASCLQVFAQTDYNNGLVLRGTYFDWNEKDEKDYVLVTAKLRMEFVNEGKEPIILISPNQEFGKWQSKIKGSKSEWNRRKRKLSNFSYNVQRTEVKELKDLAKSLDVEKPPQNLTVIIKPGDSFQFEDKLYLKLKKNNYHSFSRRKTKIEYKVSLIKYQTDADLLENLQGRWRRFGYLPVDTNGGISITSEVLSKG